MKENNKKQKQENITIPKKAMLGIAPAVAIIGVLIAKDRPGPLLLFLIGIAAGVLIGRGFFKK